MPLFLRPMKRRNASVRDDYQFFEGRLPVGRLYLGEANEWHWAIYSWAIGNPFAPKGMEPSQEDAIQAFSKAWGQCEIGRRYRRQRRRRAQRPETLGRRE
jgi:hypothetical protein